MNEPTRRLSLKKLYSGSISELMHRPADQIPFLDGLRTIAVMLVVCGHISGEYARSYGINAFSRIPFVQNGWIGVDLFFVLSGFFIGGQLWKEINRTRGIHVGRFILRRGFRIWPLYFFIFACVFVVHCFLGHGLIEKQYGWSDIVFITNYWNRGIVAGSWSLCTEEQFYIVTPFLLSFFALRVPQLRNYRPWLWVILSFIPILRAVIWIAGNGRFFVHNPALFTPIYYASITHCDGLVAGLILSNAWTAKDQTKSRLFGPWPVFLTTVVLCGVLYVLQSEVFDFTVFGILFASFAWLGLQRKFTFFDSKVFYWGSRLSFGMYLNHEYFCPWVVRSVLPHVPLVGRWPVVANVTALVIITFISVSLSLITFCLVEHPFLRMRKILMGH